MWQQSRNCISWFCPKMRLCPRAGIDISLFDLSCVYQDEHRTTESNSVAGPCDVVRVKMSNDLRFCECLIFVWFKKFLNFAYYYWILTTALIKVILVDRHALMKVLQIKRSVGFKGGGNSLAIMSRRCNDWEWCMIWGTMFSSEDQLKLAKYSCDGMVKTPIHDSDNTKMCTCQCHNSSYQMVQNMFGVINQKE